ncbi:hypothetical protein HanXRQr2_Chr05g0199751 [Helianthus annuus]|uniref:Uncharacterized protein n=1 Tax=Helianthus annuus TaxID=4232 RepID=A0A9K3NM07_HELAN|nr:hypothetical protein HanXRQr2_Chr05g0199751 [Helianthus annuus]KAJ0921523.1 hypothetical protein HanPSC8_Chr05g0192551 [Helianthus annuus]
MSMSGNHFICFCFPNLHSVHEFHLKREEKGMGTWREKKEKKCDFISSSRV